MASRSFYQFLGGVCCFAALCSLAHADDELRVFSLVNADCEEMATVLNVISEGKLIMAADRRTNSLVVKAPNESLGVIEALLIKLDIPVEHRKRHSVHAKQNAGEHEEEIIHVEMQERAELLHLRRREQMEFERHEHALSRESDLLHRRLEMVSAEMKNERAIMESEIKSISMKEQALRIRRKTAEARDSSQGGGGEEIAMLDAELASTRIAIENLKRKIEFNEKHAAPMRQFEIELQIEDRERQLEAIHAEREREEREFEEDSHAER